MWWYLIHLIGDGPQFWLRGDAQRADMKTFGGGGYYTLDFANMFMSKLFEHGGIYHKALRAVRTLWMEKGCELGMLLNRRKQTLADLSCDLMESQSACILLKQSRRSLFNCGEYTSLSVDATYKVSLKVIDQTRFPLMPVSPFCLCKCL